MKKSARFFALFLLVCLNEAGWGQIQSFSAEPYRDVLNAGFELVDLKVDSFGGIGLFARDSQYVAILTDSRAAPSRISVDLGPLFASMGLEVNDVLPIWGTVFTSFLIPVQLSSDSGRIEDFALVRVNADGYAEVLSRLSQVLWPVDATLELETMTYLSPSFFSVLIRAGENLVNLYYSGTGGEASAKTYSVHGEGIRIGRSGELSKLAIAHQSEFQATATDVLVFSVDNELQHRETLDVDFEKIVRIDTFGNAEAFTYRLLYMDSGDVQSRGRGMAPYAIYLPDHNEYLRDFAFVGPNHFWAATLTIDNYGNPAVRSVNMSVAITDEFDNPQSYSGRSIRYSPGGLPAEPAPTLYTDRNLVGVIYPDSWDLYRFHRPPEKATLPDPFDNSNDNLLEHLASGVPEVLRMRLDELGRMVADHRIHGKSFSQLLEFTFDERGGRPEVTEILPANSYLGTYGDAEVYRTGEEIYRVIEGSHSGSIYGRVLTSSILRLITEDSNQLYVVGW